MKKPHNWKGTPVRISIWALWSDLVTEIDTYLDTDTLSDVFEKYDPVVYTIEVTPRNVDDDTVH